MKTINVTFSSEEIGLLEAIKGSNSWRKAIMEWAKKSSEVSE